MSLTRGKTVLDKIVVNLLTKDDVAEALKVSVRTVDRFVKAGRLRPIRVGRAVRFQWCDVAEFLARSSDTANSRD